MAYVQRNKGNIVDFEINEAYLGAEVERAVRETREALGAMAKRRCLTAPLLSVSTLIDRISVEVTADDGESAFELSDGNTIAFRTTTLRLIVEAMKELATEIGFDDEAEALRARQVALNLFVVHELLHIRQNFPEFGAINKIKAGAPGIGLPMLDVVADTISAWTAAHVESERLGITDEEALLQQYVNALVLAYSIGCFVFDGRSKPGKRQRLLGLIVSAVLVKLKADGRLNADAMSSAWKPTSPLFLLDVEQSRSFNAIVIDAEMGMLFDTATRTDPETERAFWESVGTRPVERTLELGALLLIEADLVSTI